MQITIALDFDNCYDRMPAVWGRFIADVYKQGNRVFIVSCRACECTEDMMCENHEQLREIAIAHPIKSSFLTSGAPKRWFMEQRGIKVDIWIDDSPETIINGR